MDFVVLKYTVIITNLFVPETALEYILELDAFSTLLNRRTDCQNPFMTFDIRL